ncbi:MAG: BatD family protein [bacterium]|nr:BatD family protein [bacterium]
MRLILSIIIFLLSTSANAQELSLSASVDRNKITLNDQTRLSVSVSGGAGSLPSPQLPPMSDFNIYSSGRSQNISIVNGQVSSAVTFNYTLAPKKTGKFAIGPVVLTYQNKTYKTSPISIEVVEADDPLPQTPPQGGDIQPNRDVFITTEVDKKKAYVNEEVILTFRFYRRINLLSRPEYGAPETTGFFTEDLPPQRDYRTTVNGSGYLVTEIKTALFPTTPGVHQIGGAKLKCTVDDFRPASSSRDFFFGDFFRQGKTRVLSTNPISIEVLPLPEAGKPANFKGVVGSYSITSSLDKKKIEAGQPVTLTVTISGAGNVKAIQEASLPELPEFKRYQTLSSLNISKENYTVSGSKSFKTILIPQVPGRLKVPGISFSFFNPGKNRYETKSTAPVYLETIPAPKEETPASGITTITPEGVKLMAKDIRYLKTKMDFKAGPGLLYQNKLFYLVNLVPLLLFFGAVGVKLKRRKLELDPAYARSRRAYREAKGRLSEAKRKLRPEEPREFYTLLESGLNSYLADKLNMSAAGIAQEEIAATLRTNGIDEAEIAELRSLIEESHLIRFASAKASLEQMKQSYARALNLIKALEKNNRKIVGL